MTQFDGNDFQIILDETTGGLRHVIARPSAMVCSRQIEMLIRDNKIVDIAYARGCEGNLKGICSLVKGMEVSQIIARLKGITCGGKPTSCPDQLVRVLESLS